MVHRRQKAFLEVHLAALHLLDDVQAGNGIRGEGVRRHILGRSLRQRRPADDHLDRLSDALLLQILDDLPQLLLRGGQQAGHAQGQRLMLLHRAGELGRRHIHPQVDHLEAGAPGIVDEDVLAQVVQVAGHRADDDGAL